MPVRVFTVQERKRLNVFPAEIGESDLIQYFILSCSGPDFVRRQRGDYNRFDSDILNVDWRIHIIVGLDPEDFSRVHNVIGVKCLLDCVHNAHSLSVLGEQEIDLAAADPVLACARAVK